MTERRPRVIAEVEPEGLVVRCRGWAVTGALRRRLVLRLDQIADARLAPRREATASLGWKLAGTLLNRTRFIGGLFTIRGVKGGRQWWAAPAGDPVLVIELRDHRWNRIVVHVPGQERLVEQLTALRGA